jgi:hypothetical protein
MSYTKQLWADLDPSKPASAARFGVMEQGILDAHALVKAGAVADADLTAAGQTVSDGAVGTNTTAREFVYRSGGQWRTAVVAETRSTPYTLYVDPSGGNDSNSGRAPGSPLLTLERAISMINQAQQPGCVKFVITGTTTDVSKPLHCLYSTRIEAAAGRGVGIARNFGTPNSRSVWDAVTTAGGSSVTSATAAFTGSDVNRIASIYGAGVSGGTYYDFISAVPNGTTATLTATTTIARPALNDRLGIKMSVVGDWDRVVTDASITSGGSVVTSASAGWTTNDIGTEIVLAGAGRGGQALRSAIKTVSGNTATIMGVASATVSNKRCAIGVNFGDLLTFHASGGALWGVTLIDSSIGENRIGSALKIICDDGGAGTGLTNGNHRFDDVEITGSDTAGPWEHAIDCDGSWNQNAGGGGSRRVYWSHSRFFGVRRATETIRLNCAVHWSFTGGGIVGSAPTSVAQGIALLDSQNTAGLFNCLADVNFSACEGLASYFYSEGQFCTFVGGRLGPGAAVAGRHTIHFGPLADHNLVVASNAAASPQTAAQQDEYDEGTNNVVVTNMRQIYEAAASRAWRPNGVTFETFSRRGAANASQALGASGVMVLMAVWLPGGFLASKVCLEGGGTPLAWGTGWTGQHFFYTLYDPDGNLIGQSADGGGTQVFNNTFSPVSLASAVRAPRTGIHFIGIIINSGTGGSGFTYPTFGGMQNGLAQIAPAMCGTSGSGLTAPPSTITVPLSTGQGFEIYGGVG